MTRIVYKSIDSDSDSLSSLRCSCTSNSGGWGYSHRALEKMFRLQMPNKTAGGMHEETTHSRSAKGVCLGTLPNEPRLNEIKSKICTNHYHMVCFSMVYYALARPHFFAARFVPVPFLPFIRPLHASQNLWNMFPSVSGAKQASRFKTPPCGHPFGLGHLLSSLQVVRPSQVHGSSEYSKHSAQFSLEIRFLWGNGIR